MIVKKPSIYIYVDKPNRDILHEVCSGIEEEGVFFEILERSGDCVRELAWEGANDSMLGSGIGVKEDYVAFTIRGLKKGAYISAYRNPTREQSRLLGMNSARAIKKQAFKEAK